LAIIRLSDDLVVFPEQAHQASPEQYVIIGDHQSSHSTVVAHVSPKYYARWSVYGRPSDSARCREERGLPLVRTSCKPRTSSRTHADALAAKTSEPCT